MQLFHPKKKSPHGKWIYPALRWTDRYYNRPTACGKLKSNSKKNSKNNKKIKYKKFKRQLLDDAKRDTNDSIKKYNAKKKKEGKKTRMKGRFNRTWRHQMICHLDTVSRVSNKTWNIELFRPSKKDYSYTVGEGCNPKIRNY